jgi:hypothetical protein
LNEEVVVYLVSISGNRAGAEQLAEHLAPMGMSVAVLEGVYYGTHIDTTILPLFPRADTARARAAPSAPPKAARLTAAAKAAARARPAAAARQAAKVVAAAKGAGPGRDSEFATNIYVSDRGSS